MATVDVCTPIKGRQFSIRTAGSRMPLTPSPKARNSNITVSKTPESIHTTPTFAHAISKSTIRKSAKSNIAKDSPRRLDLGLSEWALTGTGTSPSKARPTSSRIRPKSTVRVPFNAVDRFIPNRTASEESCKMGINKLDRPKSSSSSASAGSSVLASSAADAFTLGGHGSSDDLTLSLDGLNLNDRDDDGNERKSYTKPARDTAAYESTLASACGINTNTRILAFKPAPPESSKPIDLRSQYNRPLKPANSINGQLRRRILTSPERVLDAPSIVDDYYLNLLDWSCNNQVAIGLGQSVYIWSAESGGVNMLLESTPDTYVSSLKWSGDGAYVSVGLGTGEVQIWDVEEQTKLRSMYGHESRVSVQAWSKHVLSTGARNGWLFNHDVRIAQHKIADLESHTGEVCGLDWRADGAQLASGGNDNLVSIWDARSLAAPKFSKTNHNAAVKALAWCPWQNNLLATGGGSHDRHIHFWNSTTGARVNSIDTGSQVTSLRWSTGYKEIASTSGFPDNSISVWSYPSLVKNIEIPAHESRVLHSCLSPDGQTMATAAADESLKFWKIFEKKSGGPVAAPSKGVAGMERGGMLR
ncbi:cell division cycle protein Cdc20 [Eremomyces bilateralis CBS 781.70]|uniref:Cell division cycle protein Cdc20 n=1 Tax=Eremomyces bilateralis CBS 781.70 TaxID=1392243 RepID=A0A6G1FT41_9PEZI|nr:cell division cycle protein Cdc20 [Eremomyces bilateralis CBS 781.70]KAF1808841.1 cell division cycle protein Cdc20 [Eremomyces bilateralis CBS 781.70]